MKYIKYAVFILIVLILYSCSASTDTRYSEEKENETGREKEKQLHVKSLKEEFDFTPYKTRLDIPEKELPFPSSSTNEIWYGYEETEEDTSLTTNKKIIDKVSGYRVLVLTTDNLEEANNMRSDIYFNTSQKDVYVIFDPPFYKVMVGDFVNYSDAKDLSFKLNQLGYAESRVVNEKINIFE